MRPNGKHLDPYRKTHPTMGLTPQGALFGYFRINSREGGTLHVISSGERHGESILESWEHVSVSVTGGRLPSWGEMCRVKALFWRPDETVVQFHPPESEYVNICEVLHLWKPPYQVTLPPSSAV